MNLLQRQLWVVLIALPLLSACSTIKYQYTAKQNWNVKSAEGIEILTYLPVTNEFEIAYQTRKYQGVLLTIRNNSQFDFFLDPSKSMYVFNEQSYPLVSGESKVIDVSRPQPPMPIASQSTTSLSLFIRHTLDFNPFEDDKVAILEKDYPISGSQKTWCYITAILYGGTCWFMHPTPEQTADFHNSVQHLVKTDDANLSSSGGGLLKLVGELDNQQVVINLQGQIDASTGNISWSKQ